MASKTLWDIALEKRKEAIIAENEKSSNTQQDGDGAASSNIMQETDIFVCGMKDAGKTTVIQKFLDRDEPAKPTAALDFCYARKAKPNNMTGVKDVANIYELGGGKSMSKLIDVVVSKNNIRNLVVVLVLDLSKPNQIWDVQDAILAQMKQRLNTVINEEKKIAPSLEKDLLKKAWERVDANHVDKNMMSPLMAPLLVIGTKFDVYQDFNNPKKEMIMKTLRFLTHYYGGMLQFFSTKAEGLSSRVKATLSHLAFKTPLSKTVSLELGKPIIAPFGSDSFEQIGAPPVSADRLMKSRGGTPYELWKGSFETVFHPEDEERSSKSDPGKDKSFMDETVDSMRSQKDQELERYRKLSERKAKENQLNLSLGKKTKK